MGKYAQLVMGPAGSGKTTFCRRMQEHLAMAGRTAHIVNLDPAAEQLDTPASIDIRDLVSLEDVMEELAYGPNGGLVYCMEFLLENLEWLSDKIGDFDDDYLIIDCPGQVELYSHIPVMRSFVTSLQDWGLCGLYLIDSQFIAEPSKFIAGTLLALSAMAHLEIPHINVLSKCDLLERKRDLDRYLECDVANMVDELEGTADPRFIRLNGVIAELIEDYGMVNFVPLDPTDTDSVEDLLARIDGATQYGETEEVKEPKFSDDEGDGDGDGGMGCC